MNNSLTALANQSAKESNIKKIVKSKEEKIEQDIAIIGIAGRIGDSDNLSDFFQKVLEGHDFIIELPENRKKDTDEAFQALYPETDSLIYNYVKGGYLRNIDLFDYDFFGMPYIEMETMEPAQRAIFEASIQAIWDAGYTEKQLNNTKTGVFIGNSNTAIESYKQLLMKYDDSLRNVAIAGNLNSVLSSRISYYLNLKGSSMVIDTACSSGLVALHTACEELKRGDCNLAIVAGAKINLISPIKQEGNLDICSDDGYTRTFDAKSQGTGIGEGVISLVLKELNNAERDHDQIYAIIKGSAINQDGKSVGITAPNAEAQKNLLLDTWKKSRIEPTDIQYIEAHGTATKIGDIVEVESITKAFREYTAANQICAIGSVKSNVGHTDSISGLVGLVKCIYALNHKKIPPTMHFESPNKELNFIESPIYVADSCQEWIRDKKKRTCSINSFGLSGTNACVVLQEYDRPDTMKEAVTEMEQQILWISAKNKNMLMKLVHDYMVYIRSNSSLNLMNLCYTANVRREQYEYQVKVAFHSYKELVAELLILYKDLEEEKAVISRNITRQKDTFDKNVHCISIPGHPLVGKRCWISKRRSTVIKKKHNLEAKLLISTIRESVYHIIMSLGSQWELGEHRVNDRYLLVGTSYIEIIAQIAYKYYRIDKINILDFILINGLYTESSESIEFQIYIEKEDEKYLFEMDSMQDGVRTNHCKGVFSDEISSKAIRFDLNSILSEMEETQKVTPEIYLYGLVDISDRWHVTKNINIGKKYYVAEIEIPDQYKAEANEYILYPTVLDAALNFSNTLQGTGAYLPWMYGQIQVYSKIPNKLYSIVKAPDKLENEEVLKFDVMLTDQKGNVVAEIKDYVVKRVELEKSNIKSNLSFSKRTWVEVSEEDIIQEHFNKNVIFYRGETTPLQETEFVYKKIVEGSDTEYKRLFADIGDVERIIYDGSIQTAIEGKDFSTEYDNFYVGFFSFMKTVINLHLVHLKEILVITNNGYAIEETGKTNPFGASLSAGLKSLKFEFPKYTFRYLDYEDLEKGRLAEFVNRTVDTTTRVVRKGIIYQEQVIKEKVLEKDTIVIRNGGTYIVTGGLGGIGLTAAMALAESGAGTILLLGRSAYSNIEDAREHCYSKTTIAGNIIDKIKEQGVQIEYFSVDVSDYKGLRQVLEKIQREYGQINGLIHAAGLAGEGLFYHKQVNDVKKVMDVKIKGIVFLKEIMQELSMILDFVITCSSFTALAGSIGQWDYAVANEFMNVYCQSMNDKEKTKYLSIIWTTWAESGMAYRYGFKREECILEPVSNQVGKEYFKELFILKGPELIVGRWNDQLIHSKDVKLNIQFQNRIRSKEIKNEEVAAEVAATKTNDLTLTGIKKELLRLWIRVLGRDDIDEDDKFFEMEGNSILATYLLNEVNEVYDNIFDITDIFTYSSITSMAGSIYKKLVKPVKQVVEEYDDLDTLLQELVDGKVTVDEIKSKI